jgi:hypothetical protein
MIMEISMKSLRKSVREILHCEGELLRDVFFSIFSDESVQDKIMGKR